MCVYVVILDDYENQLSLIHYSIYLFEMSFHSIHDHLKTKPPEQRFFTIGFRGLRYKKIKTIWMILPH